MYDGQSLLLSLNESMDGGEDWLEEEEEEEEEEEKGKEKEIEEGEGRGEGEEEGEKEDKGPGGGKGGGLSGSRGFERVLRELEDRGSKGVEERGVKGGQRSKKVVTPWGWLKGKTKKKNEERAKIEPSEPYYGGQHRASRQYVFFFF